jgi:hypothetical protein
MPRRHLGRAGAPSRHPRRPVPDGAPRARPDHPPRLRTPRWARAAAQRDSAPHRGRPQPEPGVLLLRVGHRAARSWATPGVTAQLVEDLEAGAVSLDAGARIDPPREGRRVRGHQAARGGVLRLPRRFRRAGDAGPQPGVPRPHQALTQHPLLEETERYIASYLRRLAQAQGSFRRAISICKVKLNHHICFHS